MSADELIPVCGLADLADESIRRFDVDGTARILVRCGGGLYALQGVCTHEDADLADGDLDGTTIWCPLHASGFDVRTGEVLAPPAESPLETYDVNVRDGVVYVSAEPTT